jgi:hypothetical protein
MTINKSLIQPVKSDDGPEAIDKERRALVGGALAAMLVSPRLAKADFEDAPNNPFCPSAAWHLSACACG